MPQIFDHYGRYLIVPSGGTEPKPFTRATTHAATLDDRYALEKWGQRMVALGLVKRPDLLALVAAHADEPTRVDTLVVDATEAAAASKGRNIGEALHRLTERLDRGELALSDIGDLWRGDIAAYQAEMQRQHFTVDMIEQTIVVPSLQVAGKLDRVVFRERERFILDVKTGQHLGHQTIAIQLAIYAHAETLYNPETGEHSEPPPINQSVGFVMHIAAGSGECRCVALDLEQGWRGAQLAHVVRSWRRAAVIVPIPPTRREWLTAELLRMKGGYPEAFAALAAQWPLGVPGLTTNGHSAEQLDLIVTLMQRIEGEHRIPFGEPDPALSVNQERISA